MKVLINVILFQLGWFACVISVSNHMEYVAICSVIAVLAVHIYLVKEKYKEVLLILAGGFIGFFVDSILIVGGVFSTSGEIGPDGLAPVWLVMLWMLFSATINHSLRWLGNNYLIAGLVGFIFAPFAYYFGSNFNVLTFSTDYSVSQVMIIIGSTWAFVTPLIVFTSKAISINTVKVTDTS